MTRSTHLSLIHLTQRARRPADGPPPLLLLLHGVGSHEEDLIGLAPALDPRFFIVSARAPNTLGPGAYAWFHVQFLAEGFAIDADEAERSRQTLLRFIDEAVDAYELDPHRVFLVGFSQGGIMSLSVALTGPEKLAGVVAMSSRVLPEIRPLMAPPEALTGLPILLIHGTADQVIPVSYGRAARDLLSALPVRLTYREYAMGHQVTAESLEEVNAWLHERLQESRAAGD